MWPRVWTIIAVLVLYSVGTAAETATGISASTSISEIMEGVMMPAAAILWNATAVYSTAEGIDDRSPKNDEEWQQVDQSRIAMSLAIEALRVPGRSVEPPGHGDDHSAEELTPEQIGALIASEPKTWVAKLDALNATVMQAQVAIENQDVEALREIGGALDDACESCHKHFWYPEK